MRIGIDNISPGTSTARKTLGGMRHFLQGIVRHLPEAAAAHDVTVVTPDWADRFEPPFASNLRFAVLGGVPRHRLRRVIFEQTRLAQRLSQLDLSVWVGTCNSLPLRLRIPAIVIVQSLQYFRQSDSYSLAQRLYLRWAVRYACRRAEAVIAFSQASKHEVVRRLGVSPAKITVIYHAQRLARDSESPETERGANAPSVATAQGHPYVLSVSAFYGYKNLPRLLQAFARLKPKWPHKLVLVGAETKQVRRRELESLSQSLGITEDVLFVGWVSDSDLPAFYRGAAVTAMPSLDETFGFPVLEAMALGCPVLTSNVGSMKEIAGDCAVLVNPYSVDDIARGLQRLLEDPELRRVLQERGVSRAAEFTYTRFFSRMLQVIERVGGVARSGYRVDGSEETDSGIAGSEDREGGSAAGCTE